MERLDLSITLENLDQIEETSKGLNDLNLETQTSYLEFLKKFKDIERGKIRGKGFSNCQEFNHTRNPRIYTALEREFNDLAEGFGLHFKHEVRIRAKDRYGKQHIFKLDFLHSETRVNVEISPSWHKDYLLVVTRDKLRKRLLKKHKIRSLTVFAIRKNKMLYIDRVRALRILKHIQTLNVNPNCLSYWLE